MKGFEMNREEHNRADDAISKLVKQLMVLHTKGAGSDPADFAAELKDIVLDAINKTIDARTEHHTISTIR
ncbi:hypothetical protein CMI37_23110 [Candidatus Pacearchaeota archaeon]|nr:hypothetical protein [Candidatus Pacearchaeota archaeon]